MKKALLWGMGECFRRYITVVKYYEWSQQFRVVGVTSNMSIYDEYYGYKYINKNRINDTEFDFIIILADDPAREIYREAIAKGIAREHILNYRVLMLSGFDLNRCTALKKNPPSIFSNNCWGGLHIIA